LSIVAEQGVPPAAGNQVAGASSVPAGGGEMGELIRSMDWSQTPLGPIESWSPALRMMVRFLLANRFPLLLWWGPQYISIYNDPYRPVLGAKHPWALGRPVSECWSEIWHILQPLIDTPFNGGPATWNDDIFLEINRYGFIEETHFTIAYSPVPDDSVPSGIGGVLATVHEITDKVVGDRRVVALRDLGARVGDAKTAEEACTIATQTLAAHARDVPFVLLYLVDADRTRAHLAGAAGVGIGEDISPLTVDLSETKGDGWPFAEALRSETVQVVPRLDERFAAVPAGPWSDQPDTAVLMPIPSSKAHEPAGLMVAGVSARLKLDAHYRDFLDLVRMQVATAITNARAYEAERRRAEALAELDRAKTAFFSNVSHEFRTPLTLMLGPVEDLLAGAQGRLEPQQRDELEVAHRNSLRLLRLVNTLLDFSRIEAGRIQASYKSTDLPTLTADLASTFRSAVERAGLLLVVDCPSLPDGLEVYVDREMWEKVVLNLLSNAFKHTFDGEIAVALWTDDDSAAVRLVVRDTGTGIPAAELPRLFERFHRVQGARARTHEGTGIGLALVQELVKLHGGTIGVESAVDVGTTFTISIPTGRAHLPADRIAAERSLASTATGATPYVEEALLWLPGGAGTLEDSQGGAEGALAALGLRDDPPAAAPREAGAPTARVLLADDNADMRAYVARLLAQRYEVEAVPDGEAALIAARERPPDLVLADVMMPRLDGFGLLRALRENPRTREVPVVLLSARAGEEARVEGIEAGADDYLVKPFAARELLARVGTHLELARVRREKAEVEQQARLAAEAERARLNELLRQAPAIICVLRGPEHVIELANPRYLELVGNRDVLGKSVRQVLPEIEGQGVIDLLDRVYATGEPYVGTEVPVRIDRRGNGTLDEAFVDLVYQPIREAGRVTGIIAHGVEVTEHVRAREALRAGEEARARLAAIVDSSDDVIIGKTLDGIITSWNPGAARLYGYAADEVVGRPISVIIPPDRPDELPSILQRLRRGERIEHFETVRMRKDGTPVDVSISIAPIRDAGGQFIGAATIARDITERKRAEEERQRLEHEKDAFLAAASHDLKNPLASIKGNAQLIGRQVTRGRLDPARLASGVASIDSAVSQMVDLIDALLDVTRLRLGRPLDLKRRPTDLVALARRAADDQQATTERHRLVVESSEAEIVGDWDARRVERVLGNLLNNAVKYSPRDGRITIELRREEDASGVWAAVAVRDQGVGIPANELTHIFVPFHRAANVSGAIPGTGIGLHGARQIVEQHGGTITVESREGEGSTFTVRLPLAPDRQETAPAGT
jgi:PAS domain S-box-containing protein